MKRLIAIGLILLITGVLVSMWITNGKRNSGPKEYSHGTPDSETVEVIDKLDESVDQTSSSLPSLSERIELRGKSREEVMEEAYNTRIEFYGMVVDRAGNPVSEAAATLTLADKPGEKGTVLTRIADGAGRFSISGVRGLALYVTVDKEGYHQTNESSRRFVYTEGLAGASDPPLPSSEAPAIFVLQKQGKPAKLIHVPGHRIRIPKDGSTTEVSLRTGMPVGDMQGDMQLQVWTENDGVRPNEHVEYPWRCTITVRGGGLIERRDSLDFQAPSEGYEETIELEPQKARWSRTVEKEYFVVLSGGSYARIEFLLQTWGEHFIVLESFVNPTPGDRNLEYDRE